MLTIEEVNQLQLRELNVQELEAQIEVVWETVDGMMGAEIVSAEILASEISV